MLALSPDGLVLEVPASVEGVAQAQPAVARFLEDRCAPAKLISRAELILEEVVMNTAMHGFQDPAGKTIRITVRPRHDGAEMIFEDDGRAFDPVAATPRPAAERFDEDRPGGLGLVLLRRMAASLAYERLPEGINRLHVTLVT